ncbi:uncharacterized protein LOC111389566 [Olea europaea var. sylvestris]|uniref:uncharacterized protein LOC111389566 n=1 Tax=Olea europaea var. sylvestris TaxID=158386 RepID=UPI000C1CCC96|nr:uncharacterized protein LOC111389566 [Olea europaea var. sylvestris]
MAVNSNEECQKDHVVGLPDEGTANPESKPQLNVVSHMENLNTTKSEMHFNAESDLQNDSNLKTGEANNYVPCILDVDIEKGNPHNPKSNDESVVNLKTDDSLVRALQREISLQLGGKFMQLLMNHASDLPKFASRDKYLIDRIYDTHTNRSRKYKRSASFNSRRVVLLFSVLSSMGTIILIYLTLRVRQIGDGSGNL